MKKTFGVCVLKYICPLDPVEGEATIVTCLSAQHFIFLRCVCYHVLVVKNVIFSLHCFFLCKIPGVPGQSPALKLTTPGMETPPFQHGQFMQPVLLTLRPPYTACLSLFLDASLQLCTSFPNHCDYNAVERQFPCLIVRHLFSLSLCAFLPVNG